MQYKVITPILGERRFEVGELIDLRDNDAAPLLRVGAIEQARLPYQQPSNLNFNIDLDR